MNKKIFAILLVLICALSISTVSAADPADASADDSLSFTKLNGDITDATEGDTVELTDDYKYNSNDDQSPIDINKNLTIDGKGHTIDASGKVSIFTIGEGKNVTIKDITFINGNSTTGGAITNNGILTLINCKFINNTAAEKGGAVYNAKILTVDNCVFDGNDMTSRDKGGSAAHGGGAIYSIGNTITNIMNSEIKNSIKNFKPDRADVSTGVIFVSDNLTVTNCKFTNNYGRYGGAICASNDNKNKNVTVIIKDSTFKDNHALYGGAINEQGDNVVMTVSNCNFIGNQGFGRGDVQQHNSGGAINIYSNAQASIENCNFTNNSAQYGGAIQAGDDNGVNVSGCSFINNSAQAAGGAITVYGITSGQGNNLVKIISNCNFIGNTASEIRGGAVYVYSNGSASIENSNFINNSAPNGGAIQADDDNGVNVSGCSFINNSAQKKYGGAIGTFTASKIHANNLTISDCSFINNSAPDNGGAIYNVIKTTVINSVFDNNNASKGADIYSKRESYDWYSYCPSSLTLNNVTSDGKGIYISSSRIPTNITNTILATEMKLNNKDSKTNVTIGEDVVISGTVAVVGSTYPKVNGAVNIFVDGVDAIIAVNVVDGKFNAPIKGLAAGNYNATLVFNGENYISSNATVKFTVNKNPTSIAINPIDKIKVGGNITVSGTTTGIANNDTITIALNGNVYNVTVKNNKFSQKITNVTPEGTAVVVVSYVGNDTVADANDTATVTVGRDTPVITFDKITAIVGEDVIVSGTVIPEVADITIIANDKTYNFVINNGKFSSLNIGKFNEAGNQTIIAKFAGNDEYINITVNEVFAVVKKATSIAVDNVTGAAGDVVIKGTTTGVPEGAIINITVDGKNYNATVKASKFSATAKNLAAGVYNVTIKYAGTDVYAPADAVAKLNLTQVATSINMSDLTVVAGQNITITGTTSGIPDGAVIVVNVAGKNYNATVNGSKFSTTVELVAGNYNVTANYDGNITYKAANDTAKLTINKIETSITVDEIGKIKVGDNITVSGTTTGIANNTKITITLNGKEYTTVVVDGKFLKEMGNATPEGTAKIVVSYAGDANVAAANDTIAVTVGRDSTIIEFNNITATVGEDVIVSGTIIPEDATFTLSVDGKKINVTAKDGKFSVNIGKFNVSGDHTIVAEYAGDKNYTNATFNEVFTVAKKPTTITVDDVSAVVGDNIAIAGAVTGIPDGAVINIAVGAVKVNATVNGSKFSANVELGAGNYNITVKYAGDEVYAPASATAKLNITKNDATLVVPDVSLFFQNGTKLVVYLTANGTNISNETVIININGVNYTRTIKNGTAGIAINLAPGEYVVTVSLVSDNYNSIKTNATVTVLPVVRGNDTVLFFQNGTKYVGLFLDGQGKPLENASVKFNINGVFYYRTTDANGTASLNINLAPGEYIITATNIDNGAVNTNKITVLPTIISENIVKYYKNETQYVVKVVDGKGNGLANQTVNYNINGVFYKRTTDANGTAVFTINLAAGNSEPKDYIITATCNGCSVSNNVTVLPVLTADDFNTTFGAGEKFIATIVDGEGNPLQNASMQFNINGVFYNRTSDVNGTIGLNINLAPGEYIITTTCKDNDAVISNKVTVKAKV